MLSQLYFIGFIASAGLKAAVARQSKHQDSANKRTAHLESGVPSSNSAKIARERQAQLRDFKLKECVPRVDLRCLLRAYITHAGVHFAVPSVAVTMQFQNIGEMGSDATSDWTRSILRRDIFYMLRN